MKLREWREGGKRWTFEGHSIFYRDDGAHPRAILFIHGFPTASWDWHRLWEPLASRYRLVAPDLLGFGFSAKPADRAYSIHAQADLVEALARECGLPEVHLMAHDYGDTVAQELLVRFNSRRRAARPGLAIRSLCLLNGGLFPEEHRPRLIQRLLLGPAGRLIAQRLRRQRIEKSLAAVFGPETGASAGLLEDFWQLISHNGGHRIAHKLVHYIRDRQQNRSRWVGALQAATVPLRFIDGLADPISGSQMVRRYLELIPAPDVIDLDNIGHYPQLEAPEVVLDAYREFLARIDQSEWHRPL